MNDAADVVAWRKEKRRELIAQRQRVNADVRHDAATRVTASIEAICTPPAQSVVAFCWPYKDEIDVRFAIRTLRARGATAALPAVQSKAAPLEFRAWWPGVEMIAGALGIPVPQNTPCVTPHVALVPLVGFDDEGYRLGYGGGYFDRTLASMAVKPVTFGIGLELARLATIHPQPHDIPMDLVVTEAGIYAVLNGRLQEQNSAGASQYVNRLASRRALW